jgi:mono/diheme cytochrome c family protein
MCHKKADQGEQLKIWEESAHSKAFETLKSEEATKIAGGKAYEKAECLSCHTTGHGSDAALFGSKFKVEDGVQCEACHGAGSEYKSKKIMEDHAKSVAAGMTEYADEAAIEAQCITCHNKKSPTFKGFKFKEMWAKIAHPVPSKG